MKKKLLVLLLGVLTIIGLTACGSKEVTNTVAGAVAVASTVDTQTIYDELEGQYFDSYSQRATATVVSHEGYIEILVSWANSAAETVEWNLTARFGEDGLLHYNDEEKSINMYDEKGNVTKEVIFKNGIGYFTLTNGALYWDGSSEESNRKCVFEKAK